MSTNVEYQVFDKAVKATVKVCHVDEVYRDLRSIQQIYSSKELEYPPIAFTGIAVYKEGDTFDVEKAKSIARKKAMRAAYSSYYNAAKEAYNDLLGLMNSFEEEVASLSDKKRIINSEILDLIKD
jgi:hypothetical protein